VYLCTYLRTYLRIFAFYSLRARLHRLLPLFPGDTIAIVAPSSAPHKQSRLTSGLAALEAEGFILDWEPQSLERRGYLAGSDAARARQLNRAITHSHAKAIMCVRGGYGAMRILDRIDYSAARRSPKLLIGFSDVTALHLALYKHAAWRGLSGPLVVSFAETGPRLRARFLALARGELAPPIRSLEALQCGTAHGTLLGGNLSMVARLVGTPHMPSLRGAILFLEDVGEAPYRIDALLAQLRLAGHLDRLGGVVLGAFTGWEPRSDQPVLTPAEIFADYFADAKYPVATGLRYGHFSERETIPVGVPATLAVTPGGSTLSMHESICG